MSDVNKVFLIGRLGNDPDKYVSREGTSISKFRMATSRVNPKTRDKYTDWHPIVVYGKQADICNEHLKKGRLVCIEGRIQHSTYVDKENIKRFSTIVVGEQVNFLDSKGTQKYDTKEEVERGFHSLLDENNENNEVDGDELPF